MSKGVLSLIVLVLLAGAAGDAQQPTAPVPLQTPTFRADVNLVEVHAVVTDERGNFVTGLSKEDFEIYEDGRLQTTSLFELMNAALPSPAELSRLTALESDVRTTVPRFNGRLYVLVLDDLHTTTLRSPQVRLAAQRFVDQHLGPEDLAAIVYTSGRQDAAQELTGSRRLLRASLQKFQGQKLPSASAERLGVHFRERETESAKDSADSDSSGRASSNNQPGSNRIDDPFDGERGFNARRALEMIRDVAQWLRDVNGRRKALVLFSEGLDYDIYDVFNNKSASSILYDARDAIAAAQRANVAIYAVDPRGLTQLGDESIAIASLSPDASVEYGTARDFQRELLLAQESLMWLAEDTGGIALVRSNDIAGGLRRIAEDNSRYYMLGYITEPARAPGKFRTIDVRVKRPGLKVRARRGYMPPDPKAAAKKRAAEVKAGTTPALSAALNNPLPVGELPVRVFAAALKGTGRNATVVLSVEVDAATLPFDQRDGRFNNKLEVSIVAADHHGKVRGTDRRELNLKLKPETHQKLTSGGVRFVTRLDLPPARYQIRVGVHESAGGAIATVPYDLEVPDYSKTPFTLSNLVLTSTSAAGMMTPEPDSQIKQRFPLPPVAARVFDRQDALGVVAELYDDSTDVAHMVDFTVSITPVDQDRALYNASESRTVEAKRQTHGYETRVPLRDLAPGAYVLRVEAVSRFDGRKVAREVPFAVKDAARAMTY